MRIRLFAWSCVLAITAIAVPAYAQTFQPRQPRPEWGIFASGVSKTEQRLVLTATFGGGYEDDLSKTPPVDDGSESTSPYYSGLFGSAGASLKYSVDKKTVYGDVQFGAYGRNYRDMTDPFVGSYSADGNFSLAVGKKGTLGTSAFAGQYLYNLAPMGYSGGSGWAPGGVPQVPGDPGAFTTGETYRGFGASASYNHSFNTKLSGYAGYSYYANDSYTSVTADGKYDSQWASGGLRYALGKGLGLRAGYSSTFGGFYAAANPLGYRSRTIDAGVDFNKSLSPTRKSKLTFGTGVSGILDPDDKVTYYFVGNVNFVHELGRTWSVYASLNRTADFFQTLGQPTINDWAVAGLSGYIGRHVEVQGGLSYWVGSAVGTNDKIYDSTNAFASTRIGLSRIFSIGASYTYYRYGFTNSVVLLPPGYLQQTDRQVFQVSLIVWAPLVTKAPTQTRSTNASR